VKQIFTRLLLAGGLFAALAALCSYDYLPPLPNPLALELILDRGSVGEPEPLLVSGHLGAADFLWVRRVDDTHVTFGYDSWARPEIRTEKSAALPAGQPLQVTITAPGLDQLHESLDDPPGQLRVTVAGTVVLEAEVHYYKRGSHEFWLGVNPLGGTGCGPELHGKLRLADGREVRGNIGEFISVRARLAGWLRHSRQVYLIVLLCAALAMGWIPRRWFQTTTWRAWLGTMGRATSQHRWFVGTTMVSALVFAWMITQGSFRFFEAEPFASFYDYQLSAFLQGQLNVPEEALGGEAFIFGGKIYGYFGPTPALLRLPFALLGFAFGELSRACMLAYFVAGLTGCYLLLRQAVRLAGGGAPSDWATVVLVGNAGLGSSLFFLGSRAYIYHEAILCGAMLALFSCYFALRHLDAPTAAQGENAAPRWWLWALGFGVLSLHARPPTGLFALTVLGCVSVAHLARELRARSTRGIYRHLGIGALCIAGVLTFNGMSYLKFETFEGAPLRLSRPYDAERLAKIEGKSFHAANLPYGFYTYLVRPNLRVEKTFPWVFLVASTPGRHFPQAKIDLPDPTLALPFGMPVLFLLTTAGCVTAVLGVPTLRSAVMVVWLAVVPMGLALFAAVAAAQRYTGDFVPFLVCGAVLGLAALDRATGRRRAGLRFLIGGVTVCALWVTFALTLHHQREMVWGVPESARQDYQALRHHIDHFFGPPHSSPSPR
jgi:hypothetical protein